ncbi:MAG TPA: CheR family methyltransferase, partial [Pseudolabrys sp.]|nr:CheR family methyltransferase [Pseudolabrys sp.]
DASEWATLDDLCHITISRLYRDKHVFDLLGARVLPELGKEAGRQARAVRCWCAGCASGEEVYTLRILWDLEVQPTIPQVRFELIGTDVEDVVLTRARLACFSAGSLTDAPARWRDVAFDRVDRLFCVRAIHREDLKFLHQDIRSEIPAGPFDLILCRNLAFTYFEPDLQRAVLDRMAAVLRDGGYFVIGTHEQLPQNGGLFEPITGCREIFRKVP